MRVGDGVWSSAATRSQVCCARVANCTIGARAATTWFVLTHLLGRTDVRVFDGSWAEWGLNPANPVARI